MEARGVSGSNVSEDNQVSSPPSSSAAANGVVAVHKQQSTATKPPSSDDSPSKTKPRGKWSMASNESLFSIQVGNMSFHHDNLSGELDPSIIDSTLFEFPVKNLSTLTAGSTDKSNENSGFKSDDGTAAAKAIREVPRDNEAQQKNHLPKEPDHHLSRSMSQFSDTSCKSFAFPILATEADHKSDSSKRSGTRNKKQQQSSRPTTANTTPPHTPPETPKPLRVPETPKAESSKSSSKGTQNGGLKRWFSCFSCFPSCS